jgi:hypothetical protein
MEILDKECQLREVPFFVEDAAVVKYFKECVDETPLPDATLKELMGNSVRFPTYFFNFETVGIVRSRKVQRGVGGRG